jgi:hypothetical protein
MEKIPADWVKDYTVEVDPDFTLPPLMDIVRYLSEWGNNGGQFSAEAKEKILRIGIMGKPVTVFYKGEKLETFTINNPTDLFDNFEVLKKNPPALMVLQQTACARMLEKSLPLPTANAQPAAATTQSQVLSSVKPGGA